MLEDPLANLVKKDDLKESIEAIKKSNYDFEQATAIIDQNSLDETGKNVVTFSDEIKKDISKSPQD